MKTIGIIVSLATIWSCSKQAAAPADKPSGSLTEKRSVNPPPKPALRPGWDIVFEDDFNGSAVNQTNWVMYDGPGHAGNGLRKPSAFSVANGMLTVTAQKVNGTVVSGGMAHRYNFKYGRIEAAVRTDDDPSKTMSGVLLTWPQSGQWPQDGEIDFYETGTNRRENFDSWVHWGQEPNHPKVKKKHYEFDAKEWHIVAMDWDASYIKVYVDDQLQWTVRNTAAVPQVLHHLCIQLDAFGSNLTAPTKMQVDWVRVYKKSTTCPPTLIIPYAQVNDGAWQQTEYVISNPGNKVKLGPQPGSASGWYWTGAGTSGTNREQTIYPTASGKATASYWNSCGVPGQETFHIQVTHALNWGFESVSGSDPISWVGYGDKGTTTNAQYIYSGSRAGRITTTGGSSEAALEQTVTGLAKYTKYRLRAKVRVQNAGDKVEVGVDNYGGAKRKVDMMDNWYREVEITFTTGNSTTAKIYMWKQGAGSAYIDDVIVERRYFDYDILN